MKAITVTLFAMAAAAPLVTAIADEAPATEVIVVTAKRPDPVKKTPVIETRVVAPAIDYSRLAIQAPELDRPVSGVTPRRVKLAAGNHFRTTS